MHIAEHVDAVNARLAELDEIKDANLYIRTEEYRSRASSGAMEREKEEIIGPAMNYIRNNFGLEATRLEGLEKALGELTLGIDEGKFRQQIMQSIAIYCEKDRIADHKMQSLNELLLGMMEKEIGGI